MAISIEHPRNSPAMKRFWYEFKEFEPTVQLGGAFVDKDGYHNARELLTPSLPDYSVSQVSYDREGPANYGAAIDLTLPDAAKMRMYSKRLDDAMRRKDVRLFIDGIPVMREYIGTLNSSTVSCYVMIGGIPLDVGADSGPDYGRDSSHLYHIHGSWIRKFCNTWQAFSGVLSILKNESFDDWEFAMPTADEIVDELLNRTLAFPYGTEGQVKKVADLIRFIPSQNVVATGVDTRLAPKFTALLDGIAALAAKIDLDPNEIESIRAAITVPTAEENAAATVDALGGVPVATLADVLHNVLGPEKAAELKEML